MGVKLTTEEVADRIHKAFIQDVVLSGEYKNKRSEISLHCNDCGYDWSNYADNVMYGENHKCPNCKAYAEENELTQWKSEQHLCECCGKLMTEFYGSGRFCSEYCSHSREHTDESRLKTANSVKKFYAESNTSKNTELNLDFSQYVDGTKELYLSGVANYKNLKYYKFDQAQNIDFVICPYCGARMSDLQAGHLKSHNKTKADVKEEFGEDYPTSSQNTKDKRTKAGSEAQRKLIEEGRHKGWQSRKVRSYAELFWEKILDNNGIEYEPEHTLKKKRIGVDNTSNYFLDFFIDGFIDLEIDGKQHKYEDRQEHDKARDKLLKQHGFVVYRIPWINPKQKEKVKSQIDEFLSWYNNIKDEEGIIVYS